MTEALLSGQRSSLSRWIKTCAKELGFQAVGIVPAEHLFERDPFLERWNEKGCAGTMSYMKAFNERLGRLESSFPMAKSVIVLAVSYYAPSESQAPTPISGPAGRVARYARGRDYHKVLGRRLKHLTRRIRETVGEPVQLRHFVDTGPILERKLASLAGLGFIGKNTTLITPSGSYFFLAEVVTDIELAYDENRVFDGCGQCTLCIDACPTEAIREPYFLDARHCISYLTIEHRGAIQEDLQPKMGDWVFGCDICIDVCPFNGKPIEAPWEEFRDSRVGETVPLEPILALESDETFREKFRGTPLLRAKRDGLVRNAAIVLENLRKGTERLMTSV